MTRYTRILLQGMTVLLLLSSLNSFQEKQLKSKQGTLSLKVINLSLCFISSFGENEDHKIDTDIF